MKKLIFVFALFVFVNAVKPQNTNNNISNKNKTEYWLAWGLFRFEGKEKKFKNEKEIGKTNLKIEKPEYFFDSTKYERKSILWGAAQWTQKKKVSDI